jgi:hypothetical protein
MTYPETPEMPVAPHNPPPEPPLPSQRIRWQRDPDQNGRLVVLDALTGKVIAIVQSLFDMSQR